MIQGNLSLFIWGVSLLEALFVVSQKWSFPTALLFYFLDKENRIKRGPYLVELKMSDEINRFMLFNHGHTVPKQAEGHNKRRKRHHFESESIFLERFGLPGLAHIQPGEPLISSSSGQVSIYDHIWRKRIPQNRAVKKVRVCVRVVFYFRLCTLFRLV